MPSTSLFWQPFTLPCPPWSLSAAFSAFKISQHKKFSGHWRACLEKDIRRFLLCCHPFLINILLSFQWVYLLAELPGKIIWKSSAGKICQACQTSNETCFIYAYKKTRKHRMDETGSSCLVINYSAWVIYWSIMLLPHPSHKQSTATWDGINKQIK